jgi:hypothetical protein
MSPSCACVSHVHNDNMPPTEREKRLHMLLSDDEDRMIRAIADADGLSVSDAIRQMIRRTFTERWPTKVKTKR